MLAPLIFAAAVAAASPPPAWEPLACLYCDVEAPRADLWSYDAAAHTEGQSAWRDYIVPEGLRGRQFTTQAECLSVLRQSMPAGTSRAGGEITTTRYRRDHVRQTESIPGVQTATALYGCFQHHSPVS